MVIHNHQREDIRTKNTLTDHLLDYWKTNLYNNILIRSAQADLSGNAGNGKWAAGGRFAFTTTKNNLYYDTLHTTGVFMPDANRSNSFQYDEYISAVITILPAARYFPCHSRLLLIFPITTAPGAVQDYTSPNLRQVWMPVSGKAGQRGNLIQGSIVMICLILIGKIYFPGEENH
ncbi:outer membrane beta-barrel protein [Chitinophaga polysaccharea]|uniref:outer membrane beta-barrel protein n=1 Tax=Chitinophaga polysaccharea TaxID=1293035 RepID=UPI001156E888|nr:outer membrane beta-barrel protein [Chitinophaga polysaccharea]